MALAALPAARTVGGGALTVALLVGVLALPSEFHDLGFLVTLLDCVVVLAGGGLGPRGRDEPAMEHAAGRAAPRWPVHAADRGR